MPSTISSRAQRLHVNKRCDMSRTKKAARKLGGKRKAEDSVQPVKDEKNGSPDQPVERPVKKPRKTGPAQQRSISHDESIAKRDPSLLADLFAQKVAKHYGDSSILEQQDISISKDWIQDTTVFEATHTADQLASFLDNYVTDGRKALTTSTSEGSPKVIIISPSGIRVADVNRELKDFNTKDTKVAKFIAKHEKLKVSTEFLSKTKVGLAVSTPGRFKDLLDNKALKVEELVAVVLDVSYQDEKNMGILDGPQVFKQLIDLLTQQQLKTRLEDGKTKVLVF